MASEQKVLDIIKKELLDIKNKYADERRTSIDMTAIDYIEDESLIPEENILITLTNRGYIKRLSTDSYKTQNRGGVGVKGMSTNEEDFVEHMINMSTHEFLLLFTNKGKVYRLKGYEIPEFSRQSKGLPIINLIQIDKDEYVTSMIKLNSEEDINNYLIFATKQGFVKRTSVREFTNIRNTGKISISLHDGDHLISVKKCDDSSYIMIGSSAGRMVLFNEKEIRIMGRTASGVRGISLIDADVVGLEVVSLEDEVVIVTEKGYGKRNFVKDYRITRRGSKGVKALNITDKNGIMVSFKKVINDSDLLIVTNFGMIIRLPLEQINQIGRVTQGVRLIALKDNQVVSTISLILNDDENLNQNNTENNEVEE